MWIVINISGKQEIVRINQQIDIDHIKGNPLDILILNRLLLVVNDLKLELGRPIIQMKKLIALVIQHFFEKKILILRFKRKKHYKKIKGFRNKKTRILVKNIYSL